MARTLQIVERNKAEKILRFINYIIDFIFSMVLVWTTLIILVIVYYFITDSDINVLIAKLDDNNSIVERIIIILLYALMLFLTETLTKGRSLGKYITGTKVVKTDGSDLTTSDLLRRNFSRAIPFDMLSFIGSNGWHDQFSDTAVVRLKNFEIAKGLEIDMETLGRKENL